MKEKIIRMIHIVSTCIPLLLMGLLIAHRILTGGGITAEELLAYTPESPIMAALVMILFFLCKSLSIFFPVTVLCIASGLLFPLPAALLVVTMGLGLGTVVMYWMGRWQGRTSVDKLLVRYPKAQHLQDIQSGNVFSSPSPSVSWACSPVMWSASIWEPPARTSGPIWAAACWAFCRSSCWKCASVSPSTPPARPSSCWPSAFGSPCRWAPFLSTGANFTRRQDDAKCPLFSVSHLLFHAKRSRIKS